MLRNTIYAAATPPTKSGVAIVRISGAFAASTLQLLTNCKSLPSPRVATLASLYHPEHGELIDTGLIFWFPGPNSFTGEDVVELHVHGSCAVLSELLEVLSKHDELSLAEPGEFSKRAFYNEKMDLTQAEGLSDLIDAETSAQKRQALRQMRGEMSATYNGWRQQLIDILAQLEAYIDFPDEELPESLVHDSLHAISELRRSLSVHLSDQKRGEKLRDGLQVAIVGPPNVGKSSLLNTLAQRDVAIVSDIAGTTRDTIEVHLDIAGFPITVIDTAGLRESTDAIESEGIRRALEKAEQADLVLALFDASLLPCVDDQTLALIATKERVIPCFTKCDLYNDGRPELLDTSYDPICLSALNTPSKEVGLSKLLGSIKSFATDYFSHSGSALITRTRHREALSCCVSHLDRFTLDHDITLACEDLRLAARELGRVTGRIEVDDILDSLFSHFCIGK